jgi:hypothetical protein
MKLAEGCGEDLFHRVGRLQKDLEAALTECDWSRVRRLIGCQFSFSVIGFRACGRGTPCVTSGGLAELMPSHEHRGCLGNMEFRRASVPPVPPA